MKGDSSELIFKNQRRIRNKPAITTATKYFEQKKVEKLLLFDNQGFPKGTIFKQVQFLYAYKFRRTPRYYWLMIQRNVYKYLRRILRQNGEKYKQFAKNLILLILFMLWRNRSNNRRLICLKFSKKKRTKKYPKKDRLTLKMRFIWWGWNDRIIIDNTYLVKQLFVILC